MVKFGIITQSNGRNLIIKTDEKLEIGVKLRIRFDETIRDAEVVDILGPVEQPYTVVKLNKKLEDSESLINKEVSLEG